MLVPRSFELDTTNTDLQLTGFIVGHNEYSMVKKKISSRHSHSQFNTQAWKIFNGNVHLSNTFTSYINASGSVVFDLSNEVQKYYVNK